VVQEWNKLSQDAVDARSVNEFKNRLDKFWRRYGHEKLGLTSPSSDKYKYISKASGHAKEKEVQESYEVQQSRGMR